MRIKEKIKCAGTCKKLMNLRSLYLHDGKRYCCYCIRKFRKIVSLGFANPNKPPKHVVEGQYWKKKKPTKEKLIVPKIPGVKKPRRFKGSLYSHLYLTKTEKTVLYKKYISNGLTTEQANLKLSNEVKYLSDLILVMKSQGFKDKELNQKFKEEFAKLVEGEG